MQLVAAVAVAGLLLVNKAFGQAFRGCLLSYGKAAVVSTVLAESANMQDPVEANKPAALRKLPGSRSLSEGYNTLPGLDLPCIFLPRLHGGLLAVISYHGCRRPPAEEGTGT